MNKYLSYVFFALPQIFGISTFYLLTKLNFFPDKSQIVNDLVFYQIALNVSSMITLGIAYSKSLVTFSSKLVINLSILITLCFLSEQFIFGPHKFTILLIYLLSISFVNLLFIRIFNNRYIYTFCSIIISILSPLGIILETEIIS